MFRSTVLGCAAGLLMALDGLHFVLSRTRAARHLPDVLRPRRVRRAGARPRRPPAPLAARARERRRPEPARPRRPAAVRRAVVAARRRPCCSAARCAVKWSALFFLPAFAAADHLVGDRRPALRRRPPAVARHASSTRSAGSPRAWSSRSASTWRPGPAGSSPTTATTGTGWRGQRASRAAGDRRAAEPVGLPPGGVPVPQRPRRPHTRTSPGRGSGCCSAGRSRSTGPATGSCGADQLRGRGAAAGHAGAVVVVPAGAGRRWPGSASPAATGGPAAIAVMVVAGLAALVLLRARRPHDVLLLRRAGGAVPDPRGDLRARRHHDAGDRRRPEPERPAAEPQREGRSARATPTGG